MSGSRRLEGRVAFVAGAGSSHGRALAVALAEAGAAVALGGATRATSETFAVNSVANELWALGARHQVLTLDYREPPSVSEAVRAALSEFGRLDLLVNAAQFDEAAPFAELSDAAWQQVLDLNLAGAYLTCKAVGQAMLEQGSGSILNVVSAAVRGRAGAAPLAAAQAGVVALSRSLALEWAGRLAVNAVIVGDETAPRDLAALALLLVDPALTGQLFEL